MNTGQVLDGRYQIEQQLGKNVGRRTLLAHDLTTQKQVVIKLLLFGADFAWDDLKLFEREAETLRSLSHPAIPQYLDYFELSSPGLKGFALVQSYVEGRSLEDHLQAGRTFSETEVQEIAKALLEILIYLHDRQPPVIHRDIKPSNILLANRSGNSVGQVHLVDFGSVQTLAAREGKTITVVGTYGYMPPEQFGGRAVPASDLYSLGATLITLATGTHPADLPQQDLRIQFESAVNLSPTLTQWLRLMVEPGLDRRCSSARLALQTLEQPSKIQPIQGQPANYPIPVSDRPAGSKVSLTKTGHAFDLLIPAPGFSPQLVPMCFFAIGWNTFLVFWFSIALWTPAGPGLFMALFALPHLGVGLHLIRQILFTLFGKTRLSIDWQAIAITYELFGLKYSRPRPASRQDINRLELEYQGDVQQGIAIWAGTQTYRLAKSDSLTEPELTWLAQELSDWLNIPLQNKRLPFHQDN